MEIGNNLAGAMIQAFWVIVEFICTTLDMNQHASIIMGHLPMIARTINKMGDILSNVYFFIPHDVLLPMLQIGIALVIIRIIFAIVQLIWW